MKPLNLSSFYYLQPATAFWALKSSDLDKALGWVGSQKQLLTDNLSALGFGGTRAISDQEQYRLAVEKQVNDLHQYAIAQYADKTSRYTAPPPIASVEASTRFIEHPDYDAFFKESDTNLTRDHLRLFISTPFYKGPGEYTVVCSNLRVISFAVAAKV